MKNDFHFGVHMDFHFNFGLQLRFWDTFYIAPSGRRRSLERATTTTAATRLQGNEEGTQRETKQGSVQAESPGPPSTSTQDSSS